MSRPKASSQVVHESATQAAVMEPVRTQTSQDIPQRKHSIKVAENEVPHKTQEYMALLPQSEDLAIRSQGPEAKADFYQGVVRATIRSCFDDLVRRREAIWEAREGDAELSFEGEFTIVATFSDHELITLRSQSAEIRDDKFHNCIETGAKGWAFPRAITQQKTWKFTQRLNYDVNYKHSCKDGRVVFTGDGFGRRQCF